MEKETLEEAAYRLSAEKFEPKHIGFMLGVIEGAKWQAERMYSEEDLREAFKESRQCKIFEKDMPPVHNEFEDWFEQFKKVGISKYFCECGSQKDQDCKYCTSCNSFNSI